MAAELDDPPRRLAQSFVVPHRPGFTWLLDRHSAFVGIAYSWQILTLAGALATGAGAVEPAAQVDPCEKLYELLTAVPHVSLVRTVGPVESIWVGDPPAACQVDFETNDFSLRGSAVLELVA